MAKFICKFPLVLEKNTKLEDSKNWNEDDDEKC